MTENQLNGKIFEEILKFYLDQHGYIIIPENIQNYFGVQNRANGLNVEGRGGWHQIDALGQFQFQIPFIYPIRLISEAKCYRDKIRLPIIRNFVGVIKDISENYYIEKNRDKINKYIFRFTDCGAIFSTSEFTEEAQMYAYAQGIYLITLSEFVPLINELMKKIKEKNNGINKFIRESKLLDSNNFYFLEHFLHEKKNMFCYFGIASGFYPIVIISKDEIPFKEFIKNDTIDVRIYNYGKKTNEIYNFRIVFDEKGEILKWIGTFQLPRYIWGAYMKSPDIKNVMINKKNDILNYIDIPIKIKDIRRIIRFRLDKSWINAIEENEEFENEQT